MQSGYQSPAPFPKAFLHHPYPGTQLEDALAIAKEPGVGTITLDIGANDILQFLGHTCGFPATFTCSPEQMEARARGRDRECRVHPGPAARGRAESEDRLRLAVQPLSDGAETGRPGGRDGRSAQRRAEGRGRDLWVSFASTARVINFSGTHGGPEAGGVPTVCAFTAMCPGGAFNPASPNADIHPTKVGYAAMAGVVAATYLSH